MWSYIYASDLPACAKLCEALRDRLSIIRSYTESNVLSTIQIYSLLDKKTGGVHYYFNPAAIIIAHTVGAKPCDVPPFMFKEHESLLYGSFLNEMYLN